MNVYFRILVPLSFCRSTNFRCSGAESPHLSSPSHSCAVLSEYTRYPSLPKITGFPAFAPYIIAALFGGEQ